MRNILTAAALALLVAVPGVAATTKPAAKAPAKAATAKAAPKPVVAKPEPVVVPLEESAELAQLRGAFQFGFPVYEMMRTRANYMAVAAKAGVPGVNHFMPRVTLADASAREVTTPNNDTLYSSAWLDLAGGPVTLTMPALPRRYHSAALMDLFTDNTSVLGTRMGGVGGNVLLVGPDWQGRAPEGIPVVRSATNDAWMLVRVVVDGQDDVINAADAIKQFSLKPEIALKDLQPVTAVPKLVPDARTFLAVVNEALGRGSMPANDAARMAKYADVGIVPGDKDAFDKLTPVQQAMWNRALPQLRAELRTGLAAGEPVNGWTISAANAGQFGDDDTTRAKIALGGLAALPRQEAAYFRTNVDKDGAQLAGKGTGYYLRLPANMPIGAFWSLTVYQQEKDGRLFFYDTPSKRYAITDRTKFLHVDRNGSVELFLQSAKPFGERAVNWLPIPPGPFVLVFRAYLPRGSIVDGSFALPGVEKVEPISTTEPKE